jgi:hypothetical protein
VYCNVEPTSVTPFSSPVRERALHAIMIGMLRLENDNVFNEDPPKIPDEEMFDRVCEIIENRVDEIDSDELDATREQLEYILECWQDWNPRKWEPKLKLHKCQLYKALCAPSVLKRRCIIFIESRQCKV